MTPEERRAWYERLDRRGRLIADLRAMSDYPGHSANIISIAADELEMAWAGEDTRRTQAEENRSLASGGPDKLLKAKACVALLNSAALLAPQD